MSDLLKSFSLEMELERALAAMDSAIAEMDSSAPFTPEEKKVYEFTAQSRKCLRVAFGNLKLATAGRKG